jgi:hypothetical protein
MDRKYPGKQRGLVGPTEQALADHSHGGLVGLVFGAFGECSQWRVGRRTPRRRDTTHRANGTRVKQTRQRTLTNPPHNFPRFNTSRKRHHTALRRADGGARA